MPGTCAVAPVLLLGASGPVTMEGWRLQVLGPPQGCRR